jgi:hypothetical protein
MRRAIAAAAAMLAAAGCRKEPEPPTPVATVYEWAQQSPDNRFELRQRRDQAGCRVEAVVKPDDRVLWTSQTCLPAPSGLAFLSPNGERLLVLDLFPSSQVAQGPDWSHVPLVSCWSRGAVVREYTGSELLSAARVTDMRKVLSWVRGDTFEQAHAAARSSPDGSQVTIDLVDGRSLTLGFEGEALPAPPAAAAPPAPEDQAPAPAPEGTAERGARPAGPAPLDEQALYRWEDDQGGLHFGAGAQVPPRFRKRALPVTGSVGVMPLDRAPPAAQQPAAAKEAPAAGAAPAPGPASPAPGAAAPAPAAPPPPPAAPAAGSEGSGR